MARRPGTTVEQTRARLLDAAARVFALKGYDGASISDITSEADLSSGSIYSHFGGKAELFAAVVRERAQREVTTLVGLEAVSDLADLRAKGTDLAEVLALIGASYAHQDGYEGALLVEAIVASKRHPEVADELTSWFGEAESILAMALRQAQEEGQVDPTVAPAAAARYLMMITLGARLTAALGLPDVEEDEWVHMIGRLVEHMRMER